MWKFAIAIVLCCTVASARDYSDEFAESPAYLILAGEKPDTPGTHYSKPTGKYKTLADDVISRVKMADPKLKPEAWTATNADDDKPGLVVVYPITHNLRIDDEYKRCHGCPSSVFKFEAPAYGEQEKPKWLNGTLETWMRLDHGWNDELARSTLTTFQTGDLTTYPSGRKTGELVVDFPPKEVDAYHAKLTEAMVKEYTKIQKRK